MALTTYAELKTALAGWLNVASGDYSSRYSAAIDDLITVGEARIFREARTKDMEAALSSVIASGVIAVPADYVEMKFCYVDGTPVQALERKPAEWIYSQYAYRTSDGKPKTFAREATNFIFGPYPDSAYTIKGVYYKRLTVIATSANALYTNNPDLYLMACLAESAPFFGQDPRMPLWEAKYTKIKDDVNGQSRGEEATGSAPRIRIA